MNENHLVFIVSHTATQIKRVWVKITTRIIKGCEETKRVAVEMINKKHKKFISEISLNFKILALEVNDDSVISEVFIIS